jgi:MFS transporter, PPP family, 3-phenylpropionic acid transporter
MNKQAGMSVQFYLFFFTWGVFIPYWTAWLKTKGFSIEEAGWFVSLSLIVRSVSTLYGYPALCRMAPLSQLARWLPFLSAVILLGFIPFQGFVPILVLTVLFAWTYPVLLPMNETIANMLAKEKQIDYGRSRLWGSVGYIVGLYVTGWITSRLGDASTLYVLLIGLIVVYLHSFVGVSNQFATKASTGDNVSMRKLFKSRAFIWCLFVCILLQGAHAAYNSYGVVYLQKLGIDNSQIGLIMIVAVVAEIGFFYVADRFMANVPIAVMFFIAAVSSVVRWGAIYLFPDATVFIITQVLHAITFGLTHFAYMRFVNQWVPNAYIPSAQGAYASLAMGLGTGLLTILCGYAYAVSSQLPFLLMAVLTIPSFGLVFLLHGTLKRQPLPTTSTSS